MATELRGDGKAVFAFFIGAIITIVFLASISDSVFTQTNTATQVNLSVVVPAINVSTTIAGRELLVLTTVSNSTFIGLQNEGINISTRIINGDQTVTLTPNDTASTLGHIGDTVNVTYTYNPDGYIDNSGGRSIAGLITLFGALAILVFGIVVFIKTGTLGRLMGRGESVFRRRN